MQLKIQTQNLNLSDSQKEVIERKIKKLTKYADRLSDESVEIKVNLIYEKARKSEDAYLCQLTIFAPMDTLRAEARNETLNNVVDEVAEKIKSQIDHYKAKVNRK